jgi:hypothetical protein
MTLSTKQILPPRRYAGFLAIVGFSANARGSRTRVTGVGQLARSPHADQPSAAAESRLVGRGESRESLARAILALGSTSRLRNNSVDYVSPDFAELITCFSVFCFTLSIVLSVL